MISDFDKFLIALDSIKAIEYKHKYFIYQSTINEVVEDKIAFCKDYLKDILNGEDYKTSITVFDKEYFDYLAKVN